MEQLLSTKFYIPPTREKLVSRPLLVEKINQGLHRKLTLISAPAGFGKTTLVSEWVERIRTESADKGNPINTIAWLSLNESDNDPVRFMSYLITALRQTEGSDAAIGDSALNMLKNSQSPPTKNILTALINDIAEISNKIILILDDYHLISQSAIDDALTFLLTHLPPQLQLIIVTRVDPHLPLARLRAGDQLNELRALDLRFSSHEATKFLNVAMGLKLSEEEISSLETRTEGWIAGLQLAAISMQGQADNTKFIKSFTGSQHLILDYLIEEVLNQLPENLQDFLLNTAILDELTGSLCDAVTGKNNSAAILEALEHENLFIIPLDAERRWYRYHHLFKDFLYLRLKQNRADQLSILHSRASDWYEALGNTNKAFIHAIEAGDFERAADIVEPISMKMITDSRLSLLHSWVLKLPDDHIAARPWLCVSGAWADLLTGQMSNVEKFLDLADSTLSKTTPETLSDHGRIYGHATTIRAFLARWKKGDIEHSIELSKEASKYIPRDSTVARSALTLNLGAANLIIGDLKNAISALDEAITVAKTGNNHYVALAASYYRGLAQIKQGYLHQVAENYQEAIQLGIKWGGGQPLPATGYAYLGLAQVLYERNEVNEAFAHLARAIELGELANEIAVILDGTLVLSQLKLAHGEIQEAAEAFESVKRILENSTRAQVTSQSSAQQALIWLAEENSAGTLHWIREQEALLKNEVYYPRMPEYLTLARVLIFHNEIESASRLLRKLREDAEANDRKGDLIKIFIIEAVLSQTTGDTDQAITILEQALILAESENYLRIFIDEGPQVGKLLYEAVSRRIAPDYVNRLLAAFVASAPEQTPLTKTQIPQNELIEPLTDREIEILALISEGLTNREIAERLYLSFNTVKAHTRNIFSKLDVNNRINAIARARAIGILLSE